MKVNEEWMDGMIDNRVSEDTTVQASERLGDESGSRRERWDAPDRAK